VNLLKLIAGFLAAYAVGLLIMIVIAVAITVPLIWALERLATQ
jgi:hypothetical protein